MLDVNETAVNGVIDHLKDIITPIGVKVYETYYMQMMYSGITYFLIHLLCILIMIYGLYKICKYDNTLEKNLSEYNDEKALALLLVIMSFIVGTIIIIYILLQMPDNILHIVNPNYYIIQEFLSKV